MAPRPDALDVLIVSLGSTAGLRAADEELLASLHRAGASARIVRAAPPSPVRTLMLTDLRWARAARRAACAELARTRPRALIYSTTTAALLWPAPGAIRFDAPAAANRPGRHGLWQRVVERRRLREAPLLLPQSNGALREVPAGVLDSRPSDSTLVLAVPVEPRASGLASASHQTRDAHKMSEAQQARDSHEAHEPSRMRDIAAIAYAANPAKKGLGTMLDAWRRAAKPGEELVLAGVSERRLRALGYALPAPGVRVAGLLDPERYRALLRRARVYVCAADREDYGIAQLEALAEGCVLVTTPSPGPYVALPIARELDARLVGEDLASRLRVALDDPAPDYAARAELALAPFRRAAVDRVVAEQLLPRLLA
ncbi:MAG TPA: glycosyltransferase [Solirubrobacteraceae bacterium]|nr:glycosyltransferase [Solirubrobacteraceae bacterium]